MGRTRSNIACQVTNSIQPIVGDWYIAVNVTTGGAGAQLTLE